ncbi:MAG: hypothetical protein ACE5OQ_01035 [Woeseia sp.]
MTSDEIPQDETMNGVLSVHEHERLTQGLKELPDTMPPRSVWHRIEEQARAEGLLARPAAYRRVKWFAGAGIAAAVVLAVLRLPGSLNPDPIPAAEELPSTPAHDAEQLDNLMVQSQRLEHELRAITYQPRVMRASTAATIGNLEDRIAAIDYRLNHPEIRMSPAQKQLYWRERVRLMDSLLKLRYAQAQRASF